MRVKSISSLTIEKNLLGFRHFYPPSEKSLFIQWDAFSFFFFCSCKQNGVSIARVNPRNIDKKYFKFTRSIFTNTSCLICQLTQVIHLTKQMEAWSTFPQYFKIINLKYNSTICGTGFLPAFIRLWLNLTPQLFHSTQNPRLYNAKLPFSLINGLTVQYTDISPMSSTADGFSGRSLTVFCGTGTLHKFRALNTKVYIIVNVCKLQSEICGAYSYDATEGIGCICNEGTERKWMFPRWGRRQLFSLKHWPICVIRKRHFQEESNFPLFASRNIFKYARFEEKLCNEDLCYCPQGILN